MFFNKLDVNWTPDGLEARWNVAEDIKAIRGDPIN